MNEVIFILSGIIIVQIVIGVLKDFLHKRQVSELTSKIMSQNYTDFVGNTAGEFSAGSQHVIAQNRSDEKEAADELKRLGGKGKKLEENAMKLSSDIEKAFGN